jgi:hypothetical protein
VTDAPRTSTPQDRAMQMGRVYELQLQDRCTRFALGTNLLLRDQGRVPSIPDVARRELWYGVHTKFHQLWEWHYIVTMDPATMQWVGTLRQKYLDAPLNRLVVEHGVKAAVELVRTSGALSRQDYANKDWSPAPLVAVVSGARFEL